jgi:hypothetical protein
MIRKDIGDRRDETWSWRRLAGNRVALGQAVVFDLIEGVDICCGELASRDLLGEEDVQLVERTVFGFLRYCQNSL